MSINCGMANIWQATNGLNQAFSCRGIVAFRTNCDGVWSHKRILFNLVAVSNLLLQGNGFKCCIDWKKWLFLARGINDSEQIILMGKSTFCIIAYLNFFTFHIYRGWYWNVLLFFKIMFLLVSIVMLLLCTKNVVFFCRFTRFSTILNNITILT